MTKARRTKLGTKERRRTSKIGRKGVVEEKRREERRKEGRKEGRGRLGVLADERIDPRRVKHGICLLLSLSIPLLLLPFPLSLSLSLSPSLSLAPSEPSPRHSLYLNPLFRSSRHQTLPPVHHPTDHPTTTFSSHAATLHPSPQAALLAVTARSPPPDKDKLRCIFRAPKSPTALHLFLPASFSATLDPRLPPSSELTFYHPRTTFVPAQTIPTATLSGLRDSPLCRASNGCSTPTHSKGVLPINCDVLLPPRCFRFYGCHR